MIPEEIEKKVKAHPYLKKHMPNEAIDNMGFIRLIYQYQGSMQEVAKATGQTERSAALRRQRIEEAAGVQLPRKRLGNWRAPKHMETKHIAIQNGTVLLISDTHFWPDVQCVAWHAFIGLANALKPTFILHNGDGIDGAATSRHPPNGFEIRPNLVDEIKEFQSRMTDVRTASMSSKLLYAPGNHDVGRLDRYLAMNAPAMEGVPGMSFSDLIPGWEFAGRFVFNDHRKVDCPPVIPLIAKHAFKRSGIHATYNVLKDEGTHIVHGHLHAQKVVEYTDYRGTRYGVDLGVGAAVDGPQFHYTLQNTANWRSGGALLTFEDYEMQPPALFTVTDEDGGKFRFRDTTYTVNFQ